MNKFKLILTALSIFALAACGGGGGGGTALPTYAVTYNDNGSTSGTAPAAQTKTQGTSLTLAANSGNLSKTGFTFTGWNTAADGSGTDYTVGAAYSSDAALALYAKWNKSVGGVVADGYLSGAKVCLDKNLNKKCDVNEPTGISGAGGKYTIVDDVPPADLAKYPIVVEVPAGAVDSDRGPVTSEYVLSAPAGKPEFVSPLTTLVQSQIESSGQTLTEAVASVKTQLGLVTLSPMDDYKPGVVGASSESVVAAGVAKVISTAIAENKKSVETAVGADATSTTQQVVKLVVQGVMNNLSDIVEKVNTFTNKGQTVLTEALVTSVKESSATISTSDVTVLKQQLVDTTKPDTVDTKVKLVLALQGNNVNGIDVTITLPAGVVLKTDSVGRPLVGVLTGTGSGATALIAGKYTAANGSKSATLTLGIIASSSLIAGDIVNITADLASGTPAPPATAFTLSGSKLVSSTGNVVTGASLTLK